MLTHDIIKQLKEDFNVTIMKEAIEFYTDMKERIIRGLKESDSSQVNRFRADSRRINRFFRKIIKDTPSAFHAYALVGAGARKKFNERFIQQFGLRIQVFEAKQQVKPLLRLYLDIAQYRDLVEQTLEFLRPFARHFELRNAGQISQEAYTKKVKRWDTGRPPGATEILKSIQKNGWELLTSLTKEIDLFARNAFSHGDYWIDEEADLVQLFSLEEEQIWSRAVLNTKKSTIWVYFSLLHIEWVLVVFPRLIEEKTG